MEYHQTMLSYLIFLSMVGSAAATAGTALLVPNCTDDSGKVALFSFSFFPYPHFLYRSDSWLNAFQYTSTAVNCEDALAATYCGIGAAKHFYLADATYLPAAKGGDAKGRIIQCYSGADIVRHFLLFAIRNHLPTLKFLNLRNEIGIMRTIEMVFKKTI